MMTMIPNPPISRVCVPDTVAACAIDAFERGDPVAQFLYWRGFRAGTSAEIARQALIVTSLAGGLGTVPDVDADEYTATSGYLRPSIISHPAAGSPEAGARLRETALNAWRALWVQAGEVAA